MIDPNATAEVTAGDGTEQIEAVETVATEEGTDTDADGGEGGDENQKAEKKAKDPWPKSAENAVERHKRDKRQMRAQLRDLEKKIADLTSGAGQSQSAAPDPKDFESYTDFLEAKTDFKVNQVKSEISNNGQIEALKAQKQQYQVARDSQIASQASALAQYIPDLGQVIGAHAAVIDGADDAIKEIIYDLDNPSGAVYVLANYGKLAEVMNMTPALAAHYLAQAEMMANTHVNDMRAKRATKAPDPMRGAKGTAKVSNNESLSGAELLKKYKLK